MGWLRGELVVMGGGGGGGWGGWGVVLGKKGGREGGRGVEAKPRKREVFQES